jgi:hypothetical protein
MTPTRVTPAAVVLALLALISPGFAGAPAQPPESERLSKLATAAVRGVQESHPEYGLKDDDVAVTLIDFSDPAAAKLGQFRGDQPIYPASVVKMFYMAYCHRLIEDKKLADTLELRRGLKEMIVNSDNDATAYILYAVTDAPNGAELPPKEMEEWSQKRNAVNRYFASLGYPPINACQCAYSFGPFGRERIFLGENFTNRNKLSTNATSLLMYHIATGQIVSPKACGDMLTLLKRDRSTTKPSNADDQSFGFTGASLPADYKLFSKAGWTSTARHDCAYVESPDGKTKLVLTTFTTGHARRRDIVPSILTSVLGGLKSASP